MTKHMKYTDVKAAVAIDSSGDWRVLGCKEDNVAEIEDILKDGHMASSTIFWINARVPIPQEFTATVLIEDHSNDDDNTTESGNVAGSNNE